MIDVRQIGDEQERRDKDAAELATELRDVLLRLPNIAADEAPDGGGPEDNVVVRHGGRAADDFAEHQRVAHWDIGAELDALVERAEAGIRDLGLAYRVIEICTGDMGQSHHRSFDIEVYAPGTDQWLEVSSVSWFSDYQARRGNIRYRPAEGKGTEMVHTLNGSALAVPRVWAAIVETYRQPDGSVAIPEALHPYTRGATVIRPKGAAAS